MSLGCFPPGSPWLEPGEGGLGGIFSFVRNGVPPVCRAVLTVVPTSWLREKGQGDMGVSDVGDQWWPVWLGWQGGACMPLPLFVLCMSQGHV